MAGQAGEARSALAAVARNSRLIILGDPGSGKSTFLRFLALCLAQARLLPEEAWLNYLSWSITPVRQERSARLTGDKAKEPLGHETWPHPPYLPILVTLRDFAATAFNPASPTALWQFIKDDLKYRGLAQVTDPIYEVLCQGQGILLLDGVDEVPTGQRPQVWQAIGALAESGFNRCPWIATCRRLSFSQAEVAKAGCTTRSDVLAPLEPPQIELFVTAWYEALITEGQFTPVKGESLARQLKEAATGSYLNSLASNPMLLTIMAFVQTYHGKLPNERAKLYQACIEALLLRWQKSKEAEQSELPRQLAALQLRQEAIEPLLWEIGWVAHAEQPERQDGAADIPEQRVVEIAKKHLGSYAKAEAFVEYTERRAHLLIGKGGEQNRHFSFPHRTFQEYLAGCHLANDRRFGRQAVALAEAGSLWREVLLLAAGTLVYNQKVGRYVLDALEIISPTTQPTPGDTPGWQRVWRAGEMLAIVGVAAAEADEVGTELLPRIREHLAALLTGGELTPPERAEAGHALAALGDFRTGVNLVDWQSLPPPIRGRVGEGVLLPDLDWVPIPAGEFIMGSDQGDENEKPAHRVNLPAYEMSRYPVTNVQFEAFVTAGGFRTERFWPEAIKAGYWQEGKFKGRFDDEGRDKPYDFGLPFNLANHPVVGVSWFEAVAFCHWLSEVTGHGVRLPSEAEWEQAARGGQDLTGLKNLSGLIYPWGDEPDPNKANYSDSAINATSAVGLFPGGVSPYGLHDMSGNVWEWCSTIWNEKAYPFQIQDEWVPAYRNRTNDLRGLRGGAFNYGAGGVRGSVRSGLGAFSRFGYYGFRLVRPPVFADSGL